jgi:hypothetical protein
LQIQSAKHEKEPLQLLEIIFEIVCRNYLREGSV